MTPPQEQAERWLTTKTWISHRDDPNVVASEAAGIIRPLLDELASLRADLHKLQQAISKEGLTGDALVHLAAAHREDSELMDEIQAELQRITEERDQAIADVVRMATTKIGERCEHHKMPYAELERLALRECPLCWKACAEVAEAALRELRQYTEHKQNCRTRARFYISNGCKRCHGTGAIPSTDCDECPDCQETCPECNGRLAEVACTCGLSTLLGSGLLKP